MADALGNIMVLDLTRVLAGPHCTRLLADMGADVIKIEEPGGESYDRTLWGSTWGTEGLRISYGTLHRNKRNITLNLKSEEGREIFLDLVKKADVVVQNFSVPVMERLRIGYDVLRLVNPRIVYCAISAFGQTGPYRDYPGYDSIIQAYTGYLTTNGFPDSPPCRIGFSLCDYFTALYSAYGILVALYSRQQTGLGQMIDCSIFDVMCQLNIEWLMPTVIQGKQNPRKGNTHPYTSPTGLYRTKDNKYIWMAVQAQKQWQSVAEIIGRQDMNDKTLRERTTELRSEVDKAVEKWTATKDLDEALRIFQKAGVPCAPVQDLLELLSDPQAIARKTFIEVPDELGTINNIPGIVPKFSVTPGRAKFGYVKEGKHNSEIYQNLLGYSEMQMAGLKRKGII